MNKVVLVGRLTKDPEIRTSGESAFARFSVAVNRPFKNNAGEYEADFPNCVAFGKTAEFIEKYFAKGNMIGIIGRIQTGSYTNQDGVKVYTTDVVAENVEFVESKKNTESDSEAPPAKKTSKTSPKKKEPEPKEDEEEEDDDYPFS